MSKEQQGSVDAKINGKRTFHLMESTAFTDTMS